MLESRLYPVRGGAVRLLPGLFQQRSQLNRRYLLSLRTENLLQNFYMEAGLWAPADRPKDAHWGWESPTCQLRGHFLGHWLSAAAWSYANTGDAELKGKADAIVSELARCQVENGGEWAGSIPPHYLDWAARGKPVWAPHYTLHKTLMGLADMASAAGSDQALDVLARWASWFTRWTGQFTREQMDAILDYETGGMLEVWANLYGLTGDPAHRELMNRYDRRRFFDALLAGRDVLTNQHMNTTIPEVHGAARAWEVTGEERWRRIVEAYWRLGVTERGYYATGGQTNGEIWSPPGELAARLGSKTQEHCTVYNMMRLAEYQYRWTGDPAFADYWERSLWNGVLAQQNAATGMIAYFLPLNSGAVKIWGTPTDDFWCCHGSLVQAHTLYPNNIFYTAPDGLVVSQYIPSVLEWEFPDSSGAPTAVVVRLEQDAQLGAARRPRSLAYRLTVRADRPVEFTLRLRIPWWTAAAPQISIDGAAQPADPLPGSFTELRRRWDNNLVEVLLPKQLSPVPLPDEPGACAFMDGPVVLAGLNPLPGLVRPLDSAALEERRPDSYLIDGLVLRGDPARPESFLVPDNEREWAAWQGGYRTVGQPRNFRLVPLYEVRDEAYTVYFEMRQP
jgi:DUF1680 family protein